MPLVLRPFRQERERERERECESSVAQIPAAVGKRYAIFGGGYRVHEVVPGTVLRRARGEESSMPPEEVKRCARRPGGVVSAAIPPCSFCMPE